MKEVESVESSDLQHFGFDRSKKKNRKSHEKRKERTLLCRHISKILSCLLECHITKALVIIECRKKKGEAIYINWGASV